VCVCVWFVCINVHFLGGDCYLCVYVWLVCVNVHFLGGDCYLFNQAPKQVSRCLFACVRDDACGASKGFL
jgi:hypothetical protein